MASFGGCLSGGASGIAAASRPCPAVLKTSRRVGSCLSVVGFGIEIHPPECSDGAYWRISEVRYGRNSRAVKISVRIDSLPIKMGAKGHIRHAEKQKQKPVDLSTPSRLHTG